MLSECPSSMHQDENTLNACGEMMSGFVEAGTAYLRQSMLQPLMGPVAYQMLISCRSVAVSTAVSGRQIANRSQQG